MIDFALQNDDIVIAPNNAAKPLKIKFNIGQNSSSTLRIKFFVEGVKRSEPKNNTLTLKFEVENLPSKYSGQLANNAMTHKDGSEYEIQKMLIALKTELGEMPDYVDFGSRLVEYRHRDKFNQTVVNEIYNAVREVIDTNTYAVRVVTNIDDNQILSWHNIYIEIVNIETQKVVTTFTI